MNTLWLFKDPPPPFVWSSNSKHFPWNQTASVWKRRPTGRDDKIKIVTSSGRTCRQQFSAEFLIYREQDRFKMSLFLFIMVAWRLYPVVQGPDLLRSQIKGAKLYAHATSLHFLLARWWITWQQVQKGFCVCYRDCKHRMDLLPWKVLPVEVGANSAQRRSAFKRKCQHHQQLCQLAPAFQTYYIRHKNSQALSQSQSMC